MRTIDRTIPQSFWKFVLNFLFLITVSCAPTLQYVQPQFPYPQNPAAYLQGLDLEVPLISEVYQNQLQQSFDEHVFQPWTCDSASHSVADAYWAASFIQSRTGYGENKLPHTQEWIRGLIANADSASYADSIWCGINVERTALRALPTERPFYYNFDRAGEGFPFDYLQNSALPLNTPVRVVNQSLDKAWLLVESHHAMGWVPTNQIVSADSVLMQMWTDSTHVTPIIEPITVLDTLGHFIAQARVGAIFPLLDATPTYWMVGVVVRHDAGGRVIPGLIPKRQAVKQPWPLTLDHAAQLADLFLCQPYGWGGYLNNRDCSALIKDFYTPFGIWLPRNSKAQSNYFPNHIDLSNLTDQQKEEQILVNGFPYLSLIYKPGHIMLQAGSRLNRPMVLHDLWGLKYKPRFKPEGRHIVGQAVITTLTPGKDIETPARKTSILQGLTRLTTVVNPDSVTLKWNRN